MPDSLPLRPRLIGTWKLESYIGLSPPGTDREPIYPFSENAQGTLVYTNDGYMSAHILYPGQKDLDRSSDASWAEAAKRYTAYSGPYYITNEDGKGEVLKHVAEICILPDWVGTIQVRTWKFEEDGKVLILSTEEPLDVNVSSCCVPNR